MLQSYADQHGFSNCVHYTDDGWSGGNFDRPAWKQLVEDIEAGKISTVLVKDMSRIGRDYLQTGYFTEVLFRQYEVRFIAITNNVDSNDPSSNEFTPFMNIMNEWYLRDQSRKMRTAIHHKGMSGKPTGNHAPYGYKKDPEDVNRWLIDEEAAAVVRRIFKLSIDGHGPYEIASILTKDKVESPGLLPRPAQSRHDAAPYRSGTQVRLVWRHRAGHAWQTGIHGTYCQLSFTKAVVQEQEGQVE